MMIGQAKRTLKRRPKCLTETTINVIKSPIVSIVVGFQGLEYRMVGAVISTPWNKDLVSVSVSIF